jgi:hypothetical protein
LFQNSVPGTLFSIKSEQLTMEDYSRRERTFGSAETQRKNLTTEEEADIVPKRRTAQA